MTGLLQRLIKQGGMYAVGNTVIKLSGLILAPFYLNPALLEQQAYGHLILLEVTSQVLIMLGGFGLGSGLMKFMTDSRYRSVHGGLPFSALLFSLGTALFTTVVLVLFSRSISGFLLDDPGSSHIIAMLAVYIGFKILAGVPLAFIRIKERAGLYALAISLEMVLLITGIYYYLVVAGQGLEGVMMAYIISSAVSTSILVGAMLRRTSAWHKPVLLKNLALFGLPLVFAALASQILNVGDRYMLKWFTDAGIVAVYGWSGKLGSVINMLFVQSFQLAFGVLGLKTLNSKADAKTLYPRVFRHYVIWTGWAVLGLSLLAYDVTRWVSPNPDYLDVDSLVFPIALGYMAYGLYYILINVLYSEMKTRTIAGIMMLACGINLILNYFLIPQYGALGAAYATTISYVSLVAMTYGKARKVIDIPYPWMVTAMVTGFIFTLFLLSHPSANWDVVSRLAYRAGLILAFPILILVFRIYTLSEVKDVVKNRGILSDD